MIEAYCSEHVTGPSRATRAGGAQRKGNVAQIGDERGTVDAGLADVEVAEIAMPNASVDRPGGSERAGCRGPQPQHMIIVLADALRGELRRRSKPGAKSGRKRARAESLLLAAPMEERRRLRA